VRNEKRGVRHAKSLLNIYSDVSRILSGEFFDNFRPEKGGMARHKFSLLISSLRSPTPSIVVVARRFFRRDTGISLFERLTQLLQARLE